MVDPWRGSGGSDTGNRSSEVDQGCDREQIAAQMGCSLRSVARKLRLIREGWLREGSP